MFHSLCHVYLAPLPQTLPEVSLYPPERDREVRTTAHETLQRRRYWGWKLLEAAVEHAFGVEFCSLHFLKNSFGKWTCDRLHFSLSYTEGVVAVAVSDAPVGIDLENIRVFREKFQGRLEQFLQKITVEGEKDTPPQLDAALRLWTAKESIFKCCGVGQFIPNEIDTGKTDTRQYFLTAAEPICLSLCREGSEDARFFLWENGTVNEYR